MEEIDSRLIFERQGEDFIDMVLQNVEQGTALPLYDLS